MSLFQTMDDFEVNKVIGRGGYGLVLLSRNKRTAVATALKVIDKAKIRNSPVSIIASRCCR